MTRKGKRPEKVSVESMKRPKTESDEGRGMSREEGDGWTNLHVLSMCPRKEEGEGVRIQVRGQRGKE